MQGKSFLWGKAFTTPEYLMNKWMAVDLEGLFQICEKWSCNRLIFAGLSLYWKVSSPHKQGLVLLCLKLGSRLVKFISVL